MQGKSGPSMQNNLYPEIFTEKWISDLMRLIVIRILANNQNTATMDWTRKKVEIKKKLNVTSNV